MSLIYWVDGLSADGVLGGQKVSPICDGIANVVFGLENEIENNELMVHPRRSGNEMLNV